MIVDDGLLSYLIDNALERYVSHIARDEIVDFIKNLKARIKTANQSNLPQCALGKQVLEPIYYLDVDRFRICGVLATSKEISEYHPSYKPLEHSRKIDTGSTKRFWPIDIRAKAMCNKSCATEIRLEERLFKIYSIKEKIWK